MDIEEQQTRVFEVIYEATLDEIHAIHVNTPYAAAHTPTFDPPAAQAAEVIADAVMDFRKTLLELWEFSDYTYAERPDFISDCVAMMNEAITKIAKQISENSEYDLPNI